MRLRSAMAVNRVITKTITGTPLMPAIPKAETLIAWARSGGVEDEVKLAAAMAV